MTIIAMTREMGTRGIEVARLVAERLGLDLIHRELVPAGVDPATAESEVHRFLASDEEVERERGHVYHGATLTPQEVLRIAARGDVIIRGWGAPRLLRDIPHVLCVRVCAPMENRVAEMTRRLGVSERVARREIRRSDAAHKRAFFTFFDSGWGEAENFDLILNTAHMPIETCAQLVIDAAASVAFREGADSRAKLSDRLLALEISDLVNGAAHRSSPFAHVDVEVEDGCVTLHGAMVAGGADGIEELVRTLPGVKAVNNDLGRLPIYRS
jgi:cytidylate kinase